MNIKNKRNVIIVIGVVAVVIIGIGYFLFQQIDMEGILRQRIIDNQKQADETGVELQRTDRITTFLVGVGSPLVQGGHSLV